jgi:general secretion pathway protein D
VKVKATPDLNDNDEVTLQMEFEVRALAGAKVNGLPVITNRTLSQAVRLKENETSLIGGLIDKQETKTITGLPGLAEIPGLGYTFGLRNNSSSDTEFLILVTPRMVRLPQHDSRTIYAGRGDTAGRGATGANAPSGRDPAETQPRGPTQTPLTAPQPMPGPGQPGQQAPQQQANPPKPPSEPQPQQPPL